jgi:glutamyl-Q tRNA(Asp) synthetase
LKGAGCCVERAGLRSRKAESAEFVFRTGQNLVRLEAVQTGSDSIPDRLPRLQRDELVRDDTQQIFQPRFAVTEQGQTVTGDDRPEPRLCLDQPYDRLLKILPMLKPLHHACLTFGRIARKSNAMNCPVFRFAPSPNGLLHLGHAYSALLNARMAEECGGRFLLRIEDTDESRCRPEFISAIFEDLSWIGLRWEEPVRIQSRHFHDYDANLSRLREMGAIYPCFCSRKQAAEKALRTRDPDGQPHYGGTCRSLPRAEAERRLSEGIFHGWRVNMDMMSDAAAAVWGDAVIAKRQIGSSYHIAVVTDDAIQGVTHVVRGKDIEAATPLHKLLQRLLGLPSPHYLHHDLVLDETGQKLSKSLRSTALRDLRQDGVTAQEIRKRLGFS